MKFKLNENLTTIHYTLFPSWDGAGEVEYEFEPSIEDNRRLAEYIVKDYYDRGQIEGLEEILKDALPEGYEELTSEEKFSELVQSVSENTDLFDEEAYDFFYDDAVDEYTEEADYGDDNGSGMSYKDFI
nr:MAG TPA: hypothetical protein [Caudoviricetes sp.]